MTDIPLITLNDGKKLPNTTTDAPASPASPSDPYHGHEVDAKTASRFISHLFNVPDDPGNEDALFIARTLHTANLHESIFWAALVVLQRLKDRGGGVEPEETEPEDTRANNESLRPSWTRGLFICAYMVTSKMTEDNPYRNKDWVKIAQREFTLSEINALERQLCHCVAWDVIVREPELTTFEAAVRRDFSTDSLEEFLRYAFPKKAPLRTPDNAGWWCVRLKTLH